jgi:hypothetical protein
MRGSDLDRLLAVVGVLLGLGVSSALILSLVLGYLWGQSRR